MFYVMRWTKVDLICICFKINKWTNHWTTRCDCCDRHMPPFPDRLTLTLHCNKKIISILITLFITQTRLYFVFSLARALRHQSSTRRCHSLSPLSHAYRPSVRRHSRWRTRLPSFTFIKAYMWIHVKNYFKISHHSAGYRLVHIDRYYL
jgi:hypothetical protein